VVECSCSSAHAVPFNQRLLSSTPSGTPKRKRLVERQGVLLLNGSTETQILNSTDTVAAVRPPVAAQSSGVCLSRADIEFAAAPPCCRSSSSTSVDSSPASSAASVSPLYTVASAYRGSSVAHHSSLPSTARHPTSSSQLAIHATGITHPSLATGIDLHQQSDMAAVRPSYAAAETSVDDVHHAGRSSHGQLRVNAPCSCSEPATSTDVMSTAVSCHHSRPPVTLTASSSLETIEIHLQHSPRRSAGREQSTAARGTAADKKLSGQHRGSGSVRGEDRSENAAGRRRCRSSANNSDSEQLKALLRQLKLLVSANGNPDIAQLLREVCEAGCTSPLLPTTEATRSATSDAPSVVEQLQNEITQLNRLDPTLYLL